MYKRQDVPQNDHPAVWFVYTSICPVQKRRRESSGLSSLRRLSGVSAQDHSPIMRFRRPSEDASESEPDVFVATSAT